MAAAKLALENYFADPANGNLPADPDLDIRWAPRANGAAATAQTSLPSDVFFVETNYRGCFAPGQPRWLDEWSRVDGEL